MMPYPRMTGAQFQAARERPDAVLLYYDKEDAAMMERNLATCPPHIALLTPEVYRALMHLADLTEYYSVGGTQFSALSPRERGELSSFIEAGGLHCASAMPRLFALLLPRLQQVRNWVERKRHRLRYEPQSRPVDMPREDYRLETQAWNETRRRHLRVARECLGALSELEMWASVGLGSLWEADEEEKEGGREGLQT